MATKKKGVLSVQTEWWKHLRRFGKRLFWRRHRQKEKKFIEKESTLS